MDTHTLSRSLSFVTLARALLLLLLNTQRLKNDLPDLLDGVLGVRVRDSLLAETL